MDPDRDVTLRELFTDHTEQTARRRARQEAPQHVRYQIMDSRSLIQLDAPTREDIARETWAYIAFASRPRETPNLPLEVEEIRVRADIAADPLWDYISRETTHCAGARLKTKFKRIQLGLKAMRQARAAHHDDDAVVAALAKCADRLTHTLSRKKGRAFPIAAETVKQAAIRHKDTRSPAVAQAVTFGLLTFGTVSRSGEVLALTRDDVKWHRGWAMVRFRATKTRSNIVKMLPRTGEADCPTRWLERHVRTLPEGQPLWRQHTNVVGALEHNRERLSLLQTNKAHLIEDIREIFGCYTTGHSFRRGAVVELIEQGVPLTVIQALGTWSSAETVLAYCEEAVRLSPRLTSLIME